MLLCESLEARNAPSPVTAGSMAASMPYSLLHPANSGGSVYNSLVGPHTQTFGANLDYLKVWDAPRISEVVPSQASIPTAGALAPAAVDAVFADVQWVADNAVQIVSVLVHSPLT